MNVLVVGPSITRTKGGMATVIQEQMNNDVLKAENKLTYLVSHVEGPAYEKIYYTLRALSYILLHSRKFDIVHLHVATGASFYRKGLILRLSKWLGKKAIMHMHGGYFASFYNDSRPAFKKFIQRTIAQCDLIIVLSEYWESYFKTTFHRVARVEILRNGINVESYQQCISLDTTYTHYLLLGRLGKNKGVYDLLQAINRIVNEQKLTHLHFYLAGDGDIEQVKEIISKQQLGNNAEVLGWVDTSAKKEVLKKVETVLLPSYDEALPMSLIEAMSCGKVIISTKVGGIPDLVRDQYNGYLITPGDVDALMERILYVNNHPDEMQVFKQRNMEVVKADFNLKKINIKLNELYKSLMK